MRAAATVVHRRLVARELRALRGMDHDPHVRGIPLRKPGDNGLRV